MVILYKLLENTSRKMALVVKVVLERRLLKLAMAEIRRLIIKLQISNLEKNKFLTLNENMVFLQARLFSSITTHVMQIILISQVLLEINLV